MSSKRFHGVLFRVYPHDHLPMHVHARIANLEVIVEFDGRGNTWLAKRPDHTTPSNASQATVRRVLRIAQSHIDDLVELWRKMQ